MSIQVIAYIVISVFGILYLLVTGIKQYLGHSIDKYKENTKVLLRANERDEILYDGYWKMYGSSSMIFGLIWLVTFLYTSINMEFYIAELLEKEYLLIKIMIIFIILLFFIRFGIIHILKERYVIRVTKRKRGRTNTGLLVLTIAVCYSFIINLINYLYM